MSALRQASSLLLQRLSSATGSGALVANGHAAAFSRSFSLSSGAAAQQSSQQQQEVHQHPGDAAAGDDLRPHSRGHAGATSSGHPGYSYASAGGGGGYQGGGYQGGGGYHATTILCVRKDGKVVLVGDGQVTMGPIVAKPNAKKLRRLGDSVVVGFAGSAADGLSLLERLETKLEEHPGQLLRAAVELAKQWRQDKAMRFLQAELLVADPTTTLTVSGNGDVLEPHDGVMGIGSGSPYATAAARALVDVPGMDAKAIALKAMNIAADMCIHTNHNFMVEELPREPAPKP